MKSILDPAFRYIPSMDTDVARTFARIRQEQHNITPIVVELAVEMDGGVSAVRHGKDGNAP